MHISNQKNGSRQINFITKSEYIELEETSEVKHEYENGTVLAMTDGSLNHGFLGGNIYKRLVKIACIINSCQPAGTASAQK